jgi:hypothetical protein
MQITGRSSAGPAKPEYPNRETRLTGDKARNPAMSSLITRDVKNTTDYDLITCCYLIRQENVPTTSPKTTNVVTVVPNLVNLVKRKNIRQFKDFMIDMGSMYGVTCSLLDGISLAESRSEA